VRKAKHAPAIWVGVLLLTMTQRAAKAQDSACELVAVDAAPGLQAGWLRAADDLRAALAHEVTGPECIALRLELEPSTSGILVRVRSADGRETTREVADPHALVPVVLGLLAAAPRDGPMPARLAAPPAPLPRLVAQGEPHPEAAPTTIAPTRVGVTLGLSTGIRAGVPTDVAMWDNELRIDVLLHAWSVVAALRYAFLGQVSGIAPDTDAYEEIGFGFGAGKELTWGRHSLDLTLSPSVVFVNMERDSPVESAGELAQLRIGAAARYGYPVGHGWRLTLTLDSDIAPGSLIRDRYPAPDLPPIPAWTVGLRVGAATSLL
jgi:hypothetical protein